MNELSFDSMEELNEKLSSNQEWKKVRHFSVLQDVFLCVSLVCATIQIQFNIIHPILRIAFLITGLASLVFNHISKETFQKHFT